MARKAAPKRAKTKTKTKPKKSNEPRINAADYDLGFDDVDEEFTVPRRKNPPPFYKAGVTTVAPLAAPPRKNCPPEHSRWKPGQSGNPLGGRLHDPALKAVKKMTKKELAEIGTLVVSGDAAALRALARDESATVLQRMVASVCFRVIDFGDMGALDTLLNRLVGKVKDEIAHSGDTAARVIVTLPSNGREAKV